METLYVYVMSVIAWIAALFAFLVGRWIGAREGYQQGVADGLAARNQVEDR